MLQKLAKEGPKAAPNIPTSTCSGLGFLPEGTLTVNFYVGASEIKKMNDH